MIKWYSAQLPVVKKNRSLKTVSVSMEVILFAMIALLSAEVVHTYHEPEWVTAPVEGLYSDLIEYTLYLDEVTWNDAATICAMNDAHLLSITSHEKYELIEELKLDQWGELVDKEFWSGLSQPNEGLFIWEDCTEMNFDMRKVESYKSDELCYRVKKDPVQWERRKCEDHYYFACEKKIPGACAYSTILSSNKVATYANQTTSECESSCAASSSCWSGISTDGGLCILLQSRTGSESLSDVTMFKKSCVQVAVVQKGDVPTLQNENKDVQPLLNCSAVQQTGVTVPVVTEVSEFSTVTDISPTPCYVYETLNVTNIYNTTQVITVNETETVQVTASVDLLNVINVTETFNVTETVTETVIVSSISVEPFATPVTDILGNLLTVTSTINVTATYNVTNVFNVTDTYNFTSTIYHSQCADSCRNGTSSYLSPNDPLLLEAIASMSKELTVDKKTTNSAIRKLTSASDSRPSSRAIGISGLILLIIPLSLIVICDLPAVLRNTKRMIDRSRRHCAYQP